MDNKEVTPVNRGDSQGKVYHNSPLESEKQAIAKGPEDGGKKFKKALSGTQPEASSLLAAGSPKTGEGKAKSIYSQLGTSEEVAAKAVPLKEGKPQITGEKLSVSTNEKPALAATASAATASAATASAATASAATASAVPVSGAPVDSKLAKSAEGMPMNAVATAGKAAKPTTSLPIGRASKKGTTGKADDKKASVIAGKADSSQSTIPVVGAEQATGPVGSISSNSSPSVEMADVGQVKTLSKYVADEFIQLKNVDMTNTVVTIDSKQLPSFKGSTVRLTEVATAKGEYNVTFANVSNEGKILLDAATNQQTLRMALSEKGIPLHIITTKSEADTLSTGKTSGGTAERDREEGGRGGRGRGDDGQQRRNR
jgi:hypothetical protein